MCSKNVVCSKKTILLCVQYPGNKGDKSMEVPALLRIKLWLGLQSQEDSWHKMQKDGEMAVFAETVSPNLLD